MTPKEMVYAWVEAFNRGDVNALSSMYHKEAINHQVANPPVVGQKAIVKMFEEEFTTADMVRMIENVFEEGCWGILEWKDPLGLRGCGFFKVENDLIVFQRGYWDKLSFLRQHNLPID